MGMWQALRTFRKTAVLLMLSLLIAAPAYARDVLIVYTTFEADKLGMFEREFESDYPDIDLQWGARDSTGIITAKLLAEKDNPQADMVWGLPATSLVMLANQGYFQGYAPAGVDQLDAKYVDPTTEPPLWVGQTIWIAAICFNTLEAEKYGLPEPDSWHDLTDPAYQGYVVMPNPNSSGTGFLDVSSWLQLWGEEGGWKFMDDLHRNIAWYTHSGSKPCKQAAAGEIPIGISYAYRGVKLRSEGAPVKVIAPSEGLGWDLVSFGIVKGTKNLAAAQALADWSVTRKANEIYNREFPIVAMTSVIKEIENFPPMILERMIKNDFAWAAANRQRILDEWKRRYSLKSEPK